MRAAKMLSAGYGGPYRRICVMSSSGSHTTLGLRPDNADRFSKHKEDLGHYTAVQFRFGLKPGTRP